MREQLLYVLEASATRSTGEGWLGTKLFPKPDAGESLSDDGGTCSGQGACQASCGVDGCSRVGRKVEANQHSRVRARPASWNTAKSPSMWSGCRSVDRDDDCWGDGDGYLTLRPFPSAADSAAAGAAGASAANVRSRVGSDDAAIQMDDAPLCSPGQGSSAPTSRVDRFLEVFSRLQPARKALNLYESPTPPPKARRGSGGEMEGGTALSPPRVAATCSDRRGGIASLEPKQQTESVGAGRSKTSPGVRSGEGGAEIGAGAAEGTRDVGGGNELSTRLPKRPALQDLSSTGVSAAAAAADKRTTVEAVARTIVGNRHQHPSMRQVGCESRNLVAASPSALNISRGVARSQEQQQEQRSPSLRRKVSRETPEHPQNRHHQPANEPAEEPRRLDQEEASSTGPGTGSTPAVGCVSVSVAKKSKGREQGTHAHNVGHALARKKCLPTDDVGVSGSVSEERASSTSPVSLPSHAPAATVMSDDTMATGKRRKSAAPVDRAQKFSKTASGGGESSARQDGSRNSGRMKGRLAGASVAAAAAVQRTTSSREKCSIEVESTSTAAGGDKKLSGDPPSGTKRSAPVSSQWRGSKSLGPLAHRASSGLLRSADLAPASVAELGPAANDGLVAPAAAAAAAAVDVSQEEECQGREADVFQKVGAILSGVFLLGRFWL